MGPLDAPAARRPGWGSTRIINEVLGVSRVLYDIKGKPPAALWWA
nr:hypothetical protein [Luteimonas sp. RC10]